MNKAFIKGFRSVHGMLQGSSDEALVSFYEKNYAEFPMASVERAEHFACFMTAFSEDFKVEEVQNAKSI